MKKLELLATIVAVIIAMVMLSGCSEFRADYEEDIPTAPAEPTFYWPNESGSMDVYDGDGNVIVKNVAFGGWSLTATKEKSHVASSGATGFQKDLTAVEGTQPIGYEVAGAPASYEATVKGLTQTYNDKSLSPLHDLYLEVETTVVNTEKSPRFYEETKVITYLAGNSKNFSTAITMVYVAEQVVPISVTAIGQKKVRVNFNDGTSKEESAIFGLTAAGGCETEDDNGLKITDTEKEGKAEIASFSYATKNQSFSDNVAIEGTLSYDYTYNGVKYDLQFTNDFVVVADWKVILDKKEGFSFYESSETVYTLVAVEAEKRVSLASDKSYFVVWQKKSEPEPADPKPLYWYQDIEKMIVVYDDNSTEDKDNKISASTEDKSWTGDKDLEMTGNTSKPASKTMYFSTNYGNIKVNLSALIALGGDIDYDGHKIPCKSEFIVEAGTPVLVSNGKEGFDYHKVFNVPFVVKTKTNEEIKEVASCTSKVTISKEAAEVTLVETIVNYVHKLFRTPIVNNQNITIICDNSAVFTDVMSDKSEVKAGEVSYTVKHNFVVDGVLNFNVGNINEVANKSGYFTNGAFTIQGRNFSVTEVSSEVSEVTFRNKAYSAPMCVVTPYKWNTNDKGDTLTITFVDENGTPCATANIAMKVKVTTVIPYKVVSMVATDYFYAQGDINNRKYRYAGTAIHSLLPDGSVFSFDIKKGVNSGVITKTGVVGNYAWYEVSQNNWELGLVTAEKVDEKNTDYCLRYYHLNAMNDGVIDAEKDKNLCAISLGNSEAVTSKTNYQYPIHNATKNSDGTFTVSINNNGYNSDVVGTYNFASQN